MTKKNTISDTSQEKSKHGRLPMDTSKNNINGPSTLPSPAIPRSTQQIPPNIPSPFIPQSTIRNKINPVLPTKQPGYYVSPGTISQKLKHHLEMGPSDRQKIDSYNFAPTQYELNFSRPVQLHGNHYQTGQPLQQYGPIRFQPCGVCPPGGMEESSDYWEMDESFNEYTPNRSPVNSDDEYTDEGNPCGYDIYTGPASKNFDSDDENDDQVKKFRIKRTPEAKRLGKELRDLFISRIENYTPNQTVEPLTPETQKMSDQVKVDGGSTPTKIGPTNGINVDKAKAVEIWASVGESEETATPETSKVKIADEPNQMKDNKDKQPEKSTSDSKDVKISASKI